MRCAVMVLLVVRLGLLLAADDGPPSLQLELREPRVYEGRYRSRVLDRELALSVVLPAGYQSDGPPVPVVVLLHGSGRDHRSLLDAEATHDALLAAPYATVHPSGLQGWYVDSPLPGGPRYQAALSEAIAAADAAFNFRHDRAGRGVGGWSMGGYGAAWYAVNFPDRCGALGTLLGLLDFPNAALPAGQNHAVPAHFGPAEGWPQLDPLTFADRLSGMKLWHLTGRDAFDRTMNQHWHRRLLELGLDDTYATVPGGHTWEVVETGLPHLLEFFAVALTADR